MRRPQQARAGRASTPPAPSVEELLNIVITRQEAFDAGHVGAWFDTLTAIRRTALDHTPDEELQPTDPIALPAWAFEAVALLVETDMITNSTKRGRHAKWWRRYREDLIQWHRYALIRQRLADHTAGWPDNAAGLPDVFEVISRDLSGTAFAGWPATMKTSYETVAAALKAGQHARYYRSTAAHVYDFLLGTRDLETHRGVGASYGHVYIKSSS